MKKLQLCPKYDEWIASVQEKVMEISITNLKKRTECSDAAVVDAVVYLTNILIQFININMIIPNGIKKSYYDMEDRICKTLFREETKLIVDVFKRGLNWNKTDKPVESLDGLISKFKDKVKHSDTNIKNQYFWLPILDEIITLYQRIAVYLCRDLKLNINPETIYKFLIFRYMSSIMDCNINLDIKQTREMKSIIHKTCLCNKQRPGIVRGIQSKYESINPEYRFRHWINNQYKNVKQQNAAIFKEAQIVSNKSFEETHLLLLQQLGIKNYCPKIIKFQFPPPDNNRPNHKAKNKNNIKVKNNQKPKPQPLPPKINVFPMGNDMNHQNIGDYNDNISSYHNQSPNTSLSTDYDYDYDNDNDSLMFELPEMDMIEFNDSSNDHPYYYGHDHNNDNNKEEMKDVQKSDIFNDMDLDTFMDIDDNFDDNFFCDINNDKMFPPPIHIERNANYCQNYNNNTMHYNDTHNNLNPIHYNYGSNFGH